MYLHSKALLLLLPYVLPSAVARPSEAKTVIIQMFEWSWDSIASECTSFIGPAGYGFVQVSPPSEHITGSQWWTDYQPVSYALTSKRGSRAQFANMVSACHSAGVKVMTDTIINHMAGIQSGTGVAGSSFTHYSYPGIYQTENFHHCGLTSNDDISDFTNRAQVQTCELVNLADLATETEYVRARLATHVNDLLSLGVDGLRLDAAKHVASDDIANILSRLSKSVYVTQEVIYGAWDQISPTEYLQNGDVQEFRYMGAMMSAFSSGSISGLKSFNDKGWITSSKANVFVVNHDSERGGSSLNINSANNAYVLATIFSLAHPYGTPSILSSYYFSDADAGGPNGGYGSCSNNGGTGAWICQHRFPAISGMVGFRNAVGSESITRWVSPSDARIAFGRGSVGFVAINTAGAAWTATFKTSLASGTYCDVISGGTDASGKCTGLSFTVSKRVFSATIPPRSAIAIHTGAKGKASGSSTPASVAVTFKATANTGYGESIYLVGDLAQLGTWTSDSAIAMSAASYPVWSVTVILPVNTEFSYKLIRKKSDGSVQWESDPNHQSKTKSTATQTISSTWQ